MIDGLGFEEVNQSVTSTAIISGTNVYAKTAVTAPAIVGTTSVTNSDGTLESVAVGSGTSTFGASIHAGSAALGTGSNAWVEYATAFSQKPIVTATDLTTADMALFIPVGSVGAGSFYIEGVTASDEFSWIAIGLWK